MRSNLYKLGWKHAGLCYVRHGLGGVRLADCAFAMGKVDWSVLPPEITWREALAKDYQKGWKEFTSHHRREDYYDAHVQAWEERQ